VIGSGLNTIVEKERSKKVKLKKTVDIKTAKEETKTDL
jgi:hypothetical protein